MKFCAYFGALMLMAAIAVTTAAGSMDAASRVNHNLKLNQTSSTSTSTATTIMTPIVSTTEPLPTAMVSTPSTATAGGDLSSSSSTQPIELATTTISNILATHPTGATSGENQTKIEIMSPEPTMQIVNVSTFKDELTSVSSDGDEMITIDTGTIAFSDDDDAANSEQRESGTVSFGIRSFTVEVTTATDKPTVDIRGGDTASVASPKQIENTSPKTTAAVDISSSNTSTSSSEEATSNSGITIVPIKLSSTDSSSSSLSSSSPSPNPSPTPISTKQENGLYRIKIAEIITDEFNSGMRDHDDDDGSNDENMNQIQNDVPPAMLINRYRAQQAAAAAAKQRKINIADLYPSKIEDFEPIIRESNEKLLQQQNRFAVTGDEDVQHFDDEIVNDDRNRQQNSIQINYDVAAAAASAAAVPKTEDKVNFIENNIPTTKIEIELIDEPGASKDDVKIIGPSDDEDDVEQDVEISSIDASIVGPDDSDDDDDKITDFTSKLQENDGIISTIERSFLKVANNENDNDKLPITVNKAINAMGFIQRRVKKHDPTFKNRFMLNEENRQPRIDIANTKFNGAADSIADNTIAPADNRKPEFSTTKFYNGKNLYGRKERNEAKQLKSTAAAAASTKVESVDRKIIFFNVNGNRTNAKEMARLKHDREEIIKDKSIAMNKTAAAGSSAMHLYVIHESTGRPSTSAAAHNNANAKPSSSSTTAIPMSTMSTIAASSSSANPTTSNDDKNMAATSTSSASAATAISTSTENNSQSSAAWLPLPNAETEAALIRSQKLKRLRERINSLECDIQTMMPDESTVWRGNETHELSLPTTVSF